jgi:hypothetical protein
MRLCAQRAHDLRRGAVSGNGEKTYFPANLVYLSRSSLSRAKIAAARR